jgi:hypothetical protein
MYFFGIRYSLCENVNKNSWYSLWGKISICMTLASFKDHVNNRWSLLHTCTSFDLYFVVNRTGFVRDTRCIPITMKKVLTIEYIECSDISNNFSW